MQCVLYNKIIRVYIKISIPHENVWIKSTFELQNNNHIIMRIFWKYLLRIEYDNLKKQ